MPYEPNTSLLRHFEENAADLTHQVEEPAGKPIVADERGLGDLKDD